MGIEVQGVSAWAEIGGGDQKIRTKSIEVERDINKTIGKAIVKGFPEDIADINLGTEVDVYVATESASQPWNKNLDSTEQIFGGFAHSAKQNENGIIILEAYDPSQNIFDKFVRLNTEEPRYTDKVLLELMREAYGTYTRSDDDATKFIPYIGAGIGITDEGSEIEQRPWQFGSAQRGEPLINAIEALTETLTSEFWVDKNGVVRIESYPRFTDWEVPYVVETEAGENSKNAERIIMQGNPVSSELGQGAAYVNQQTSPESGARIEDGKVVTEDNINAAEKTVTDRNITTQSEADKKAFSEAQRQQRQRDFGTVTIIGNGAIELFDHVIIPDIEFEIEDGLFIDPIVNEMQSGKYRVGGIVHKINSQDGFLTDIKLSPPLEEASGSIVTDSGINIEQAYLDNASNQRVEGKISTLRNGNTEDGVPTINL